MRPTVQTLTALALTILGPAGAIAQSDPPRALEEGRAFERTLEYRAAEARYEEATTGGPGSAAGRRAQQRLSHLRARRDPDGGYGSLAALERMRRLEATEARLDDFADEVGVMPEGHVRDDALFLLGEAWFRRRGQASRALPFYEELLSSESLSPERRRTSTVAMVEAQAAAGQTEDALRIIVDEGLEDTYEGRALLLATRRAKARNVALFAFALSCVLLLAIGRPWRAKGAILRRTTLRRMLGIVYVIGVPALIAELYEASMGQVFLIYGAVAVPLLGLALASGAELARRKARPAEKTAVILSLLGAELAAAWLALDVAGGLGSFGFP